MESREAENGHYRLRVPSNKIGYYEPLFEELKAAAETVCAGQVIHLLSRFQRPKRLLPRISAKRPGASMGTTVWQER